MRDLPDEWPTWMRLRPGESEHDLNLRLNHSCYICGVYIADSVALDAHEQGHTPSEKSRALNHRPA